MVTAGVAAWSPQGKQDGRRFAGTLLTTDKGVRSSIEGPIRRRRE